MAPSVDVESVAAVPNNGSQHPLKATIKETHREPLKSTGTLGDNYVECTTIIGREYPEAQLSELMNSPRRDEFIRDLAIAGWSTNPISCP